MSRRTQVMIAGTAAVTAAGGILAPSGATAIIGGPYYSGGGSDCAGRWHSQSESSHGGEFSLMDRAGGDDNDYCYVEYYTDGGRSRRVSIAEDSQIGQWQYKPADLSDIGSSINFKVCEERDNDPDLCSDVHNHSKK